MEQLSPTPPSKPNQYLALPPEQVETLFMFPVKSKFPPTANGKEPKSSKIPSAIPEISPSPRCHMTPLQISRVKCCASLDKAFVHNTPYPIVSMDWFLDFILCRNTGTCSSVSSSHIAAGIATPEIEDISSRDEAIMDIPFTQLKRNSPADSMLPRQSSLMPSSRMDTVKEIQDELAESEQSMDYQLGLVPHVLLTFVICLAVAIPAICVQRIEFIFQIMGCTIIPVQCTILPTLFVVSLVPSKQKRPTKVIAVLLSLMFIVAFVLQIVCEYVNI